MPEIKIILDKKNQTVNARELWESLKTGARFNDWINRRLKESLSVESIDYTVLKNEYRGNQLFTENQKIEYYLTIDKAIEICMLERTEQGMKIRQYFINEKKRLMELERNKNELSIEEMTVKVLAHCHEKIKALETTIEANRPAVEFAERVSISENDISFLEFGRITGYGEKKLFAKCRELKLIDKKNQAYQQFIDQGYFKVVEKTVDKSGKSLLYTQTRITGKGQKWLAEKIK